VDFRLYLGIQDPTDLNAGVVKRSIDALEARGIQTQIVELAPNCGRFVATKNRILESISEQFAFHVDDDYVLEHDYLSELINSLIRYPDFGCISGSAVLTHEVPIDQFGAPAFGSVTPHPFCTVNSDDILHWSVKPQRVRYPRKRTIDEVDALAEQFMFRMDRWKQPFDLFFDQGNFYLNETEWTYREFRCGFTPQVCAYHLRDAASLSLNREQHLAWATRATEYFARRHLDRSILGVLWKSKFWRNPANSSIPGLDLVGTRDISQHELTIDQIRGAVCHELSIAEQLRNVTEIVRQEMLPNGYALVRCRFAPHTKVHDFLLRRLPSAVVVEAEGTASFGGIRYVERVSDHDAGVV
jgi:hypothetical protein